MTRPLLLDLFCGLGGASVGYAQAGWDVVGVDNAPQPDYPFTFVQTDALDYLWSWMRYGGPPYAAVHASPPCQAYLKGSVQHGGHPRLTEPTREALHWSRLPYVMENPAARADVVLCGEMFGLGVLRHRRFELGGWSMPQPEHKPHRGRVRGWRHGVYYDGPYVAAYGNGGGKGTAEEIATAMGIGWSTDRAQLVEAIPPAYTQHLGAALLGMVDG